VHDDTEPDPSGSPDVSRLLQAMALCNDATLLAPTPPPDGVCGLGDPTEVALLVAAAKMGVTREGLEDRYPRVSEVPFDSVSQQMTTVHALPDSPGCFLVVRKGSPEALAGRGGRGHDRAPRDEALQQASDFAAAGFRVLAVETGTVPDPSCAADARLQLLGLIAMDDPAKPSACGTVKACRDAGIVPVLITGDHPRTALAVARRVGVITEEQAADPTVIATGDQIASHEIRDLTTPRVFARTRPEQKLDIVRAWQEHGAVVAMTGDGVNDGPALRRADIGVAMGRRGTEVARQAADMVLADDELSTVGHAVEEGRRVYDNIRRFLVFGLAGGAAEILVMLLGPFTGLVVPLVAAQILWINLLTHGMAGVAMGAEPVEADVMLRPPRPPEQSVLGNGLWQRVLVVGGVLAAVSLGIALWAQDAGRPWQSLLFLSLTCLQLGVALGLRPVLLTRKNPWLPVATLCSLCLALAGIYVPALQQLLSLQALPLVDVLIATSTAIIGWVAVRVSRPR
jgi:Ca2+-transporting ATPase